MHLNKQQYTLALLAVFFLSACSASGPKYAELPTSAVVPEQNESTVIIYRPDHTIGLTASYWVEFNGEQACDIHNASYFIKKVRASHLTITSSRFARAGTAKLSLPLSSQDIKYIKVDPKNGRLALMGVGGFIGDAMAEGADSSAGPVDIILMQPDQAKQEIAALNRETNCN